MSVYEFCRVAFGLGGNGFNPHFVNLLVGRGGEHRTETELFKENGPERIIFIHI